MGLTPFNFNDLEVFAKDVPHEALAILRRESPVYWNRDTSVGSPHGGFWLITKHKDILHVEKNPGVFSSHQGLTLADSPPPSWGPPWSMVRDGLTHLDPPEHSLYKRLIAPSFTSRAVASMELRIQSIARNVLDHACAVRDVDFARDVALRFPVEVVLGEFLGIPREDFQKAIHWSNVIAAPKDPEFPASGGTKAVREIYSYALAILKLRRRTPTQDILSILAHTNTDSGERMSDEIFVRYFWSLITGAFDTSASAISAGMLALITFPDEYNKLLAQPSVLPTTVEEILRWETPTIYFRRTAVSDTVIRGQTIRRGHRVLMCYASANRDDEVFSRPDVFDVLRKPNEHLSFGYGPHFCLGAQLARTQISIIFAEIARRRLCITLCGKVRRAQSNFQNRIKEMPVRITVM